MLTSSWLGTLPTQLWYGHYPRVKGRQLGQNWTCQQRQHLLEALLWINSTRLSLGDSPGQYLNL